MAKFMHGNQLEPLANQLFLFLLGNGWRSGSGQSGHAQGSLVAMAGEQAAVAAAATGSLPVDAPHAGRVEAAGQPGDAFWREGLELGLPVLHEVGVKDDVGVEDLAGPGVHPARSHGKAAA